MHKKEKKKDKWRAGRKLHNLRLGILTASLPLLTKEGRARSGGRQFQDRDANHDKTKSKVATPQSLTRGPTQISNYTRYASQNVQILIYFKFQMHSSSYLCSAVLCFSEINWKCVSLKFAFGCAREKIEERNIYLKLKFGIT
jgi:hypothetical protein